uniref:Uncharacterized protein n=1 Tax=Pyramimonas orientalis virus TaxID=455367 RepID=A0A7M3UPB7_POV01|nr:hypothetical protein HWQ62_00465 [Pyramimonas orientalis virus]
MFTFFILSILFVFVAVSLYVYYKVYVKLEGSSLEALEPHFKPNDKPMFYKYLDKASVYFEFGSGGSTYQASIRDNIQHIYSVESDKFWYYKLKDILTKYNKKITYLFTEMNSKQRTWGAPGPNATQKQIKQYSSQIANINESKAKLIDLVLIDGRFRVACCLKCFDVIRDDCLIAFDDFFIRPKYHVVLDFYEVVETSKDKHMVILRKKKDVSMDKDLIRKYELIKD